MTLIVFIKLVLVAVKIAKVTILWMIYKEIKKPKKDTDN